MTLSGAPDYQAQQAPTVSYLGSYAINTNLSQDIDLSNLIFPHHTAIGVYWVASGIWVSTSILISSRASLTQSIFSDARLVRDQESALIPVPGQLAGGDAAFGLLVNVAKEPSGGAAITGTVYIVAYTAQPVAVPQHNFRGLAFAFGTGAIIVPAGGTSTILAAPLQGEYYKLKCLSWRANVAPAAATAMTWNMGGTAFIGTQIAAAVAQSSVLPCEIDTNLDITFTNSSSIPVAVYATYEIWPI